jgi:hypothetical protein
MEKYPENLIEMEKTKKPPNGGFKLLMVTRHQKCFFEVTRGC